MTRGKKRQSNLASLSRLLLALGFPNVVRPNAGVIPAQGMDNDRARRFRLQVVQPGAHPHIK